MQVETEILSSSRRFIRFAGWGRTEEILKESKQFLADFGELFCLVLFFASWPILADLGALCDLSKRYMAKRNVTASWPLLMLQLGSKVACLEFIYCQPTAPVQDIKKVMTVSLLTALQFFLLLLLESSLFGGKFLASCLAAVLFICLRPSSQEQLLMSCRTLARESGS